MLRLRCLSKAALTSSTAPASRIVRICPDCPTVVSNDDESVLKTVKMAMEKYNKESGNANYFAFLNVTRASAQVGLPPTRQIRHCALGPQLQIEQHWFPINFFCC